MSHSLVITEPLFIKKKTIKSKNLTKPVKSSKVKKTKSKKQIKTDVYIHIKPGVQTDKYSVGVKFKTPTMTWVEYWKPSDVDRMYPKQCWYRYIKLRENQLSLTVINDKTFQMRTDINTLQKKIETILDDRTYENAYYINQEDMYKNHDEDDYEESDEYDDGYDDYDDYNDDDNFDIEEF